MVTKNNTTCSICGNPYYMCISCKDFKELTPWKVYTDTAEHYKIFQVIRGYKSNIYTKEEAKEKLDNIYLSDKDNFKEEIISVIDEIMAKPVKKNVERKKTYDYISTDDENISVNLVE